MTIVDFLLARIAEDEEAARASTEGPWQAHVGAYRMASLSRGEEVWIGDIDHDSDAVHAARHDPARVLAECAAKRAVIGAHPPVETNSITNGGDIHSWITCGTCSEGDWIDPYPCPTIRHLAAIYAEHPDYNPAWRLP